MARASTPPVAPASPTVGGASPSFSAKLGAWRKPLLSNQRGQQGFVRRRGNVTLSQRARIWLALVILSALAWVAIVGAVGLVFRWVS